MNLEVLAAQVSLGSEEHLNVMAGGIEDGRQVGGGHLDGYFFLGGIGLEDEEKGVKERRGGEAVGDRGRSQKVRETLVNLPKMCVGESPEGTSTQRRLA